MLDKVIDKILVTVLSTIRYPHKWARVPAIAYSIEDDFYYALEFSMWLGFCFEINREKKIVKYLGQNVPYFEN